ILKREDGLIDWPMRAAEIERRVRGLQPWPNAFTQFRAQRLVIWRAVPLPTNTAQTKPGTITRAHGDELVVACGAATALQLLEVQAEGRRRMSARDFLNGMRVEAGARLG